MHVINIIGYLASGTVIWEDWLQTRPHKENAYDLADQMEQTKTIIDGADCSVQISKDPDVTLLLSEGSLCIRAPKQQEHKTLILYYKSGEKQVVIKNGKHSKTLEHQRFCGDSSAAYYYDQYNGIPGMTYNQLKSIEYNGTNHQIVEESLH